jgi:Zn-dependent protease with chaperone function
MTLTLDFQDYVQRRKAGTAGERGEGYAFEGDRKVLSALRRLRPVELAVAQLVTLSKNFLKSDLLGSTVKVGPQQFPRLHRIGNQCAETLGIPPPTLYVVPDIGQVNASTYGTDEDAFIMVTAAAVDALSDEELRFVIGHECGHIQNNHAVFLTLLTVLQRGLGQLLSVMFAPLLLPLTLALRGWSRAAEITCDRAGLLCCRDLGVAQRSFVKLAVGSRRLFEEIDLEVYLDQGRQGREGVGRMSELTHSHPYLPKRVQALQVFAQSALYRAAVGGDGGFDRDELEKRTADVIKVL